LTRVCGVLFAIGFAAFRRKFGYQSRKVENNEEVSVSLSTGKKLPPNKPSGKQKEIRNLQPRLKN
jgi:hypothetical protein